MTEDQIIQTQIDSIVDVLKKDGMTPAAEVAIKSFLRNAADTKNIPLLNLTVKGLKKLNFNKRVRIVSVHYPERYVVVSN